jgi:Bacterial DNA-binding protein
LDTRILGVRCRDTSSRSSPTNSETRNPATGEQIKIPARTRLRFTRAEALKDAVLGVAATAAKEKPAASKAAKKR